MRSRNWSRTLTERSGGNGAVAVFMACYDCFFVQSMPRASKQQARYAVGRCLMLWSSNDVTQQGSRPKTKLAITGVELKISLISATSENGVIGNGPDIPWSAKGEQLLFKALTYNQWLLVGRKTFDSMGVLPNRKYAVVSRKVISSSNENVLVFPSIEIALQELSKITDHLYVSGGGQIYNSLIEKADIIHLSTVHVEVEGDINFPKIPENFNLVFEQFFLSNINYTYQIWKKG